MYQVGSACYGTTVQAAAAVASSQVGSVVSHGSTAYVVDVSNVSGTSITYDFHPIGGGTAMQLVAPYSPQACGLLTAQDGLEMGWLIAAAWIGVYAVLFMTRGFRTNGDA